MSSVPSSPFSPSAPLKGILLRVGVVVFLVESLLLAVFVTFDPDGHIWHVLDAPLLTVAVAAVIHYWITSPLDARLARAIGELDEARLIAERLARTDGLTGVLNRRELLDRLKREWLKAERHDTPLSLLMIDIDFFKRINDTYGHQAGDAVLVKVAHVLKTVCRDCDDVGRYGGEEFCIVLSSTTLCEATAIAERLIDEVAGTSIEHEGQTLAVTLSVGVAQNAGGMTGPGELIKVADCALYRAKHLGRNRVETMEHVLELCPAR